jgi:hypothetical protein
MASKAIPLRSPCMSIAIAIGQVGQTIFTTEQMMPPGPTKTNVIAGLTEQLGVLENEYRNCVAGKGEGGVHQKIGG